MSYLIPPVLLGVGIGLMFHFLVKEKQDQAFSFATGGKGKASASSSSSSSGSGSGGKGKSSSGGKGKGKSNTSIGHAAAAGLRGGIGMTGPSSGKHTTQHHVAPTTHHTVPHHAVHNVTHPADHHNEHQNQHRNINTQNTNIPSYDVTHFGLKPTPNYDHREKPLTSYNKVPWAYHVPDNQTFTNPDSQTHKVLMHRYVDTEFPRLESTPGFKTPTWNLGPPPPGFKNISMKEPDMPDQDDIRKKKK